MKTTFRSQESGARIQKAEAFAVTEARRIIDFLCVLRRRSSAASVANLQPSTFNSPHAHRRTPADIGEHRMDESAVNPSPAILSTINHPPSTNSRIDFTLIFWCLERSRS